VKRQVAGKIQSVIISL